MRINLVQIDCPNMSSGTSSPMLKPFSCGELNFCILISDESSIPCSETCSLLASRSLSLRTRFPAISQSQFLISGASLKKRRTLVAISYLFSTITTRWRSTYPCTPNPIIHSSIFGGYWRLLKSQIWYLVLLVRVLPCPVPFLWPLRENWLMGWTRKMLSNQLGPNHGQCGNRSCIKGNVSDSNLWNP